MSGAGDRMPGHGMSTAMVPRHLAGLHRLQLLRRNQSVHLLLSLLMNLPDFLLSLLRRKGSLRAYRLHFRLGFPLDRLSLFHRGLGNPGLLPAGRLVRLGRTSDRAGMPRQGLLNANGD